MSNPFEAPLADDRDTVEHHLAGRASRLVAKAADTLLLLATLLPAVAVMSLGGGPEQIEQNNPALQGVIVLMGLAGLVGFVAVTWTMLVMRGQTPGKWLMGIQIVKEDGSPVDFLTVIVLRLWVLAVPTGVLNQCCLGWVITLADALAIFGDRHQCLHDRIAGTRVVVHGRHADLRTTRSPSPRELDAGIEGNREPHL